MKAYYFNLHILRQLPLRRGLGELKLVGNGRQNYAILSRGAWPMDYHERVCQLQREIKQLSEAIEDYNKKRYRKQFDKHAQEMRGQRLKQIIDELAQIANWKKPPQDRLSAESRTGISKGFPTIGS